MDPELLAAMDAIENEDWSGDEQEEGFIPDDFVQQAIEDREEDEGFDFDAHIRNLLKAREERERSKVELTEDRYAEEIRIEPTNRKEREIDQQFSAVSEQKGVERRLRISTAKRRETKTEKSLEARSRWTMRCSKWGNVETVMDRMRWTSFWKTRRRKKSAKRPGRRIRKRRE